MDLMTAERVLLTAYSGSGNATGEGKPHARASRAHAEPLERSRERLEPASRTRASVLSTSGVLGVRSAAS